MRLAIWLFVLMLLSGCAATQIEKGSAEEGIALAEVAAFQSCAEAFNSVPDVSNLDPSAQMIVLMQHETAKIVAVATGKNPCDRTSWRDVQVAEVQEKNQTARSVGGNVVSLGTAGLTAWATVEISDAAFSAAGDKVGGDMAGGNVDKSTTTTTEFAPTE